MKKLNTFIIAIITMSLIASCAKDRSLEGNTNTTSSLKTDPANIIGISAAGYDKPDHWSGKSQPITWINNDNKTHSVTADDGSFDSGAINPGASYTKEFSRPGVYTYHDNFSSARATLSIFGREDPGE